ncbi:MAG: LysR family transcriptional regulator [Rhodospirillales bacterium]|nr:LysR family transcriptional regulator [Rhodospirillales bacterium]
MSTAEAASDGPIAGWVARMLSYQFARAVADGRLILTLESFEPAVLPVRPGLYRWAVFTPEAPCFLDFAPPRLKARPPP